VLAWLLDAIGTPTWALVLLPQLAISARIWRLSICKTVYVFGCVVQDAAIISFGLMGWFAQMFSGVLVGIVAVALIAIFALAAACARSASRTCSAKPWTRAGAARSAAPLAPCASAFSLACDTQLTLRHHELA
jgi:hypothetical protein